MLYLVVSDYFEKELNLYLLSHDIFHCLKFIWEALIKFTYQLLVNWGRWGNLSNLKDERTI